MTLRTKSSSVKMNAEELILIFLLQFQVVISGDFTSVYARAGDAATLPCQLSSCSNLDWWYTGEGDSIRVETGQIPSNSPRSQHLSLTDNCSLDIRQVTADDAGTFTCKSHGVIIHTVYLTVLTLTSSSLDSTLNGEVNLVCSVSGRFAKKCPRNRFRWLDEEGRLLPKDYNRVYPCRSILKVRLGVYTSSYTCQYLEGGEPKVQVQHIVPPRARPSGRIWLVNVIRIAGTVLMLVVAIFFAITLKFRRNASWTTNSLADPTLTSCPFHSIQLNTNAS